MNQNMLTSQICCSKVSFTKIVCQTLSQSSQSINTAYVFILAIVYKFMWKLTKQDRDVGRKCESGSTQRKLTAKRKSESKKLKGVFNKYLKIDNTDKEPDEKNEKDTEENND